MTEPTREQDLVARQVVDSAFAVHTTLGPGLLESVYEQCLAYELTSRNITVERQVSVPVIYRGALIDAAFRMDIVVAGTVVVEVKAIKR